MMKKHFAIVGGSIAGSIIATILQRLGYRITVFERASNTLYPDRGAGIWLPKSLIQQLIQKTILSRNFSFIPISARPIYTYDLQQDSQTILSSHTVDGCAVHWLDVYEALKTSRPEHEVIYNAEVTQVMANEQQVNLTINHDKKLSFDYCIFTDGGTSIGRQYLFPDLKPIFTNTIIWRGILDKHEIENADFIDHKGVFYVTPRGHMLIYPVPNRAAKNPTQDFKINWLFYEWIDNQHELFQHDQEAAKKNIAKGDLPKNYQEYLHKLSLKYLPPFARNIIFSTKEPFIQAMHEMAIPSYYVKNCCLLGDASIMLRAHTAAGATKAIQDALALGEQLEKNPQNIDTALKAWDKSRHAFGMQQYHLGQTLGELFVTKMPEWQKLNKTDMDKLWENVIANGACWYANKNPHK